MNKIEYNGKEIINIDAVKQAIKDTNKNTSDIATLDSTKVASEEVKKIVVCNEYPATEEQDVLYIKLEK